MKKKYSYSSIEDVKRIIEALVFASDEPLSPKALRLLIEGDAPRKKEKISEDTGNGEDAPLPTSAESGSLPESSVELEEPEYNEARSLNGEIEEEIEPKDGDELELNAKTIRRAIGALNEEYENHGNAYRIVEVAGGFQFATRKEYGIYIARLSKDKTRRRLSQAGLEALAIVAYRQPVTKPEIESIRGVNCDEVIQSLLEKDLLAITGRAESAGRPLLFGTTDAFLKYFGLASLKDLPRPREIEELLEAERALPEQIIMEIPSTENVQEIEGHLAPQHKFADVDRPADDLLFINGGLEDESLSSSTETDVQDQTINEEDSENI